MLPQEKVRKAMIREHLLRAIVEIEGAESLTKHKSERSELQSILKKIKEVYEHFYTGDTEEVISLTK